MKKNTSLKTINKGIGFLTLGILTTIWLLVYVASSLTIFTDSFSAKIIPQKTIIQFISAKNNLCQIFLKLLGL